ncbi:toxin-antitoxin system YwqK family antitoxin [uncultured Shewanella sp.]|uniref:toxin-antitoxin system YwqK family antitoxin n=1 Tax=uncultured Shewanella sp. TaxID=173975 RepID=UPI00261921B9|nr:toxin-antitoxin system YwqK family antitoxin [uncultured Shewanella sp.]
MTFAKTVIFFPLILASLLLAGCSQKSAQLECETFERCYLLTLFAAQKSVLSHTEFSQLKVVVAVDYDAEKSTEVQTKIKESSGSAEFDAFAKRELHHSVEALLPVLATLPEEEQEKGESFSTDFIMKTADYPVEPKIEPEPELVEKFYDNGQLKIRGYELGIDRVGHWQTFYEDGTLRYDEHYPAGIRKRFHENGQLAQEGYFDEGIEQGEFTDYHDNGSLRAKRNFKDGQIVGFAESYSEDGTLDQRANFDAQGNGTLQEFWPNGQLKWDTAVINGQPSGQQKYYDLEGQLMVAKALAAAKVFQQSISDNDVDTFMRFILDEEIMFEGARVAYQRIIWQFTEKMKSGAFSQDLATFTEPTQMFIDGEEYCAYLPMTITTQTAEGKIFRNSALVGYSADIGKTWKFVDASDGHDVIGAVLPITPSDLTIPKFAEPKIMARD